MGSAAKIGWAIVYIGLIGALVMGIITHADQFKTAFGALSSFFISEMTLLKG